MALKKQYHKGFRLLLKPLGFAGILCLLTILYYGISPVPAVAAVNQTLNFQTKIVTKTTGLNLVTGTPACVKAGADTCDFQIRVWNHITDTSTSSGTGNLMFTQTFQDVEIGATGGIFNLVINSCGSSQSGASEWGTAVGTCTVVDDSDADSDPGVDFNRADLYVELGFASADTTGSLGSFTELFSRTLIKSVPTAFYAQEAGSLGGVSSSGFVQLSPAAIQPTGNVTTPLIYLNEDGSSSPNLMQLQVGGSNRLILNNTGQLQLSVGGSAAGLLMIDANLYRDSADVLRTTDSLTIDTRLSVGTGTTSTTTSLLIAAPTTGRSQINLSPSAGVNVSAPSSGDLWWNGTNLYFFNGSTNKDLLAGGSCSNCVQYVPGSAQAITSAATSVIHINENDGVNSPNLVELEVGAVDTFVVSNAGLVSAAGVDALTATTFTIGNTTATGVSICNSATCDTITIGNNTDADTITIADNNDTFSIDSSAFDVSTSGAVSGVTTLATSGDWTWTATTPTITVNSGEVFTLGNGAGSDNISFDLTNNFFRVGDGTNGFTFDIDTGPAYAGTARPTRQITLSPEFPNSTLTGDGTNNTGTMTSDFCENGASTDIPNTNTTVCNTSGDIHNYYSWTTASGSAQDYDIWIRWRVPDNFSAWVASNPVNVWGKRTDTTNNAVTVFVYDTAGVLENTSGTQVAGTAWTQTSVEASFGGTYTPGSYMTIRVVMNADTGGDSVQVGEISLDYRSTN